MEDNKMLEYCKKLEGISYYEWQKVRRAMDIYLDIKISQHRRELKLTDLDLLPQAYRNI